jgi:hypothetical protein
VLVTQLTGGGGNAPAAGGSSSPARQSSASSAPGSQQSAPSTQQQSSVSTPSHHPAVAAQVEAAVRDYYALLPDDTNDAWKRLTPEYQHGTQAGGKGNYERFWKSVDSVSVSNLTATPPGTVTGTVTYVTNGRTSSERRSFELVKQDGIYKITASSIVG